MKTPKIETIQKFLLSKGWNIASQEIPFVYMTPPKDLDFQRKNFKYRLPIDETAEDYQEYVYRIVTSISDVYELNKWYLIELLSQSIEEIKQDIALKAAIVQA